MVIGDPLLTEDALSVAEHLTPYFERIKVKANGIDPDELKELIRSNAATVHPVCDEGYMIASWGEDQMFIISAGAFSLKVRDLAQCISDATDYAKQHNCSTIAFRSSRKAWHKIAIAQGFKRNDDSFTKET